MVRSIAAAVVAVMAVSGCTDEAPDETGELGLELIGETGLVASAFRVQVTRAADGQQLLARTIKPNQIVMPIDSRFVAALPAGQLLLVDVVALDDTNTEIGAGAAIVRLAPKQLTQLVIELVAYQTGGSAGILGAVISEAALPDREYLFPDPADAAAGKAQALVARLTDAKTQQPVTNVVPVTADPALGPITVEPEPDGGVAARWTWPVPQVPTTTGVELAYLDAAGRGWIASASAGIVAPDMLAAVDFAWSGQVHLSGAAQSGGRWLVGLVMPPALRFDSDRNGDGDFADANERAAFPIPANVRPVIFGVVAPTHIVTPTDIAGAIFDQDGDGKLDTIATVGADGALASAPWPLAMP